MRMNPENELVRTLYAFIGQKVEEVRRVLADEDKKRKSEEEMKRLAQQAAEIARVINEDFDVFRQQVAKVRAKTSGGVDAYRLGGNGGKEDDDILFGNELPAEVVAPPVLGDRPVGPEPSHPRPPVVAPAGPNAEKLGRPAGGSGGRKPQGGFRVQFKPMGAESHRALYERDERTIYINLEHPQLVAAIGIGSIDDPVFRRLAYGWLDDRNIRILYRVSEGMLANGIVSIPAALKTFLQGKFALMAGDNSKIGTFVVKDNSAWGLGPFFSRRGGEPGDYISIVLNLSQRIAIVQIGDAGLIDQLAFPDLNGV